MIMRVGVKILDEIVDFPEGSVSLVFGPIGSGKSKLMRTITKYFLSLDKGVLYLSVEEDPRRVLSYFSDINIEKLKIVNLFSDIIRDPRIIQGFNITADLKNVMKDVSLLILDSINEFALQLDVNQLILFIKTIIATVYASNAIALITYNSGNDDTDYVMSMVEYLFDGIIQLDVEEDISIKSIRVLRMRNRKHDPNWHFFRIEDGNIVPLDASIVATMLKNIQK
ncbi:RadA paralog [Sulfurisphaera tokodaii str. 7]|uniref:RadA paralog n=2 Tax=Sulfurisphaera tokodaii TaxID=111955 RepID=F9VNA3_SULTO|nr:RadA paralog [Sulfurisphaera tokodaii str. 7]